MLGVKRCEVTAWKRPAVSVPRARRSLNGPAKALPPGAVAAVAPVPLGARVSRSGVTAGSVRARAVWEEKTRRPSGWRTSSPNAAGARPPTFAATRWSPSNSRASSMPPYGNARWLTATIAVL